MNDSRQTPPAGPDLAEGLTIEQAYQRFQERRRTHHERLLRATEYLSEHDSRQRRAIVRNARRAMDGWITPPGRDKPMFVGQPPRWHQPYVNDNLIAGVHRLTHMPQLCQAWQLTGEEKFARFAAEQFDDWIERCPQPEICREEAYIKEHFHGEVPWNCLNSANRVYDGIWPLMDFLVGTPHLNKSRFSRWLKSLQNHGEMLENVSDVLSAPRSNHYMMYNLAFLLIAVLGTGLARASHWLDLATDNLEKAARAQFTSDGAQVEATPGYHCVSTICMLKAEAVLSETERQFDPEVRELVTKAIEHALNASRPTGTCVPVGDANPDHTNLGVGLNAFYARQDIRPLLALAQLAGHRTVERCIIGDKSPLSDPETVLNALEDEPRKIPQSNDRIWHQRQIKQVAIRTDWTSTAAMAYLNCQTVEPNGHSDQDPCGFDFCALGQPLLIDPGRVEYKETDQRRRFRSATSHNTVTVDFREPYQYRSQWQFGPQKETGIEFTQDSDGLLAVGCYQHNYEPVHHRRALAVLDDTILLVLDAFNDIHWDQSVQIYYHFPTPQVRLDQPDETVIVENGDVELLLQTPENMEKKLLDGEYAPRMGRAYPTRRLRLCDYGYVSTNHRACATVAAPYRKEEGPPQIGVPVVEPTTEESTTDWTVSFQWDGQPVELQWTRDGIQS